MIDIDNLQNITIVSMSRRPKLYNNFICSLEEQIGSLIKQYIVFVNDQDILQDYKNLEILNSKIKVLNAPEDFVFKNQDLQTGYPVAYQMTPVSDMPWELYTADMNWGEPDLAMTKKYMREVFENRDKAKIIAQQGQQYAIKQFSWEKIGLLMKQRLTTIGGLL